MEVLLRDPIGIDPDATDRDGNTLYLIHRWWTPIGWESRRSHPTSLRSAYRRKDSVRWQIRLSVTDRVPCRVQMEVLLRDPVGIDPDATDRDGNTALHVAALSGQVTLSTNG